MLRRVTPAATVGLVLLSSLVLNLPIASAASLQVLSTTLISASPTGDPSTNTRRGSFNVITSSNGRFVAFTSASTNLIPGVTPPAWETFLYDRQLHTMEIVSRSNAGNLANDGAQPGGVSDDGRFVVFSGGPTNLVTNYPTNPDGTPRDGVYLRDRTAGTTTLISQTPYGGYAQPHAMSRDGNVIAYEAVIHRDAKRNATDQHGVRQRAHKRERRWPVCYVRRHEPASESRIFWSDHELPI